MSLDRVLAATTLPRVHATAGAALSSRYQRPAIASTRAWVADTEKLLDNVRYAECAARDMCTLSARVVRQDRKEARARGERVDREVRGAVDQTAQTSNSLERAGAAHEAELMLLLAERNAAREALALVLAPLEKVRRRIELRLATPLPVEERTDTSVLESLQVVSRSLSDCSKTLIAFVKEAERHCTHMEALRQAIRLEITDRHDAMRVTYAGSHDVPSLPPLTSRGAVAGAGAGAVVVASEYARMLKSDMLRCLRMSRAAVAESILLRAKLSQCVKDIAIVRVRNERLLDVTLRAHVRDTEMLQGALAERHAAVRAELERVSAAEQAALAAEQALVPPAETARAKLAARQVYARVLRDGRAQDAVSHATADEVHALRVGAHDARRCAAQLARHRERLAGFLGQLTAAEQSKASVMELARATI